MTDETRDVLSAEEAYLTVMDAFGYLEQNYPCSPKLEAKIEQVARQVKEALDLFEDLRRASQQVDEAEGATDYQARLIGLAMIARHYVRQV